MIMTICEVFLFEFCITYSRQILLIEYKVITLQLRFQRKAWYFGIKLRDNVCFSTHTIYNYIYQVQILKWITINSEALFYFIVSSILPFLSCDRILLCYVPRDYLPWCIWNNDFNWNENDDSVSHRLHEVFSYRKVQVEITYWIICSFHSRLVTLVKLGR